MMHPEGRLVAIQQQIHYSRLLADAGNFDHQFVLNCLAKAGLYIMADVNEITIDAAKILPNILAEKAKLRLVEGQQQ